MKPLLQKIHSRLGDFWWYTALLFCANRAADCMNVFVGLWLVPKYIAPSELGAVMPLTQFATFLAMPVAIFATTFRNEIVELSTAREFGKLKTLLRGTFIATGGFFLLAVGVSYFILPAYLERIRIVNGSLGLIILVSAFITGVSPIFGNALQALKKFRATAITGFVSAPIRLVTMVLTMPLRPLSGYFVGQASTPVFGIFASIVALRKELSFPAVPYWNREVFRRILRFAGLVTLTTVIGTFSSLVQTTVLRQRLPEMDSAAYYMTTRFSEIAAFLSATLLFTMFPFTAERAKQGKSTRGFVLKASAAMLVFCIPLALFFWLFGQQILALLPNGDKYASYYWATPWLIGIMFLSNVAYFHTSTELSANRFGYLKWLIPIDILYPLTLLFITGYGYFTSYLPSTFSQFLSAHNISSLGAMLMSLTIMNMLKLLCAAIQLARQKPTKTTTP